MRKVHKVSKRAERRLLDAIFGSDPEKLTMTKAYKGVRGGTPIDGPSLCKSCTRSTYMRGMKESDEVVYCNSIDEYVPFKVMECSSYYDKTEPSKHDMEQIAWILVTDRTRGQFGFVSAKDFRLKHPREDITPD